MNRRSSPTKTLVDDARAALESCAGLNTRSTLAVRAQTARRRPRVFRLSAIRQVAFPDFESLDLSGAGTHHAQAGRSVRYRQSLPSNSAPLLAVFFRLRATIWKRARSRSDDK
jgi:hypothetical protein